MEKARSMLHDKSVLTGWWAEAVNTAVYLIKRSSNTAHLDITPFELVYKMKPQMDHLRVFGLHGYAHTDDVKRTKLEPNGFKCMIFVNAENVKGYRVFDLEITKIYVTRSVKLDEHEDGDEVKVKHQVDRQPVSDDPMKAVEKPAAVVEMDDMDHAPSINVQRQMPSESPVQNRLEIMEYHQSTQLQHENHVEESEESSEGPTTLNGAMIDEDGLIAKADLAYAVCIDDSTDLPTTYAQALASDDAMKWREAMNAELCFHTKIKRGH
ncbi:polyprotein [Plasmopara halstedii]|uniref:Polyprotein n=1 Tax=Plasmopara halstedii TaxID=4781 RepID=A0A0N7L6R4_PLAHL|nr:polyprotein [Plasmopara halstedii]CEG45003.1 polyprotein [Plasmopara halstedii]|eukprot:XP_024581372.1 polyprotein [Plasmopara halstedii]